MKILLAVVIAVVVSGCQSYGGMSAEQITAATKDKSTNCLYGKVIGVWGTAETTVVGYDQKTISNGGISIGDKCSSLTVTDTKPVPPVVKPTP